MQNEPGVLSRVSGTLAARGFNIGVYLHARIKGCAPGADASTDSLVVCQTEIRDLSRMCIVLRGQDGVIEQARRQLEDLVGCLQGPSRSRIDLTHLCRSPSGPSLTTPPRCTLRASCSSSRSRSLVPSTPSSR